MSDICTHIHTHVFDGLPSLYFIRTNNDRSNSHITWLIHLIFTDMALITDKLTDKHNVAYRYLHQYLQLHRPAQNFFPNPTTVKRQVYQYVFGVTFSFICSKLNPIWSKLFVFFLKSSIN
jgi:hypothetical protein